MSIAHLKLIQNQNETKINQISFLFCLIWKLHQSYNPPKFLPPSWPGNSESGQEPVYGGPTVFSLSSKISFGFTTRNQEYCDKMVVVNLGVRKTYVISASFPPARTSGRRTWPSPKGWRMRRATCTRSTKSWRRELRMVPSKHLNLSRNIMHSLIISIHY